MTAASGPKLKVLLHSRHLGSWFLRQSPNGDGIWGNCQFFVNGPDGAYDRVVVFDAMSAPVRAQCPPDGTLLLVGEPPAIKGFHPGYLTQFARLVTPCSDMAHPDIVDSVVGHPWYVGLAMEFKGEHRAAMTYEDLAAAAPEKTGLISVIASYRTGTPGQRARAALVEALEKRLGDRLAVLGRDKAFVADKWETTAPFKYHVVLENSRYPHYISEKLFDAYLSGCFPFYWGAPNAADYFDPASFLPINIHDPQGTASIIEEALDAGLFERTVAERQAARDLVLNRYNMFALMDHLLSRPTKLPPAPVELFPESRFTDTPMVLFKRRLRRLKRIVPRKLRPQWWTT